MYCVCQPFDKEATYLLTCVEMTTNENTILGVIRATKPNQILGGACPHVPLSQHTVGGRRRSRRSSRPHRWWYCHVTVRARGGGDCGGRLRRK